jgi:hypothetical protein
MNGKHPRALVLVLTLSLSVSCCGSACLLYTRPSEQSVRVDLNSLATGVSALPPGWIVEFGPAHPPEGKHLEDEWEGVYVQFTSGSSDVRVTHEVLEYRNELQATIRFVVRDWFPRRAWVLTPWRVPDGWSYHSSTADRLKVACADQEVYITFHGCTVVAQYGRFLSVLYVQILPGAMTVDDLQAAVRAIDERMARELGRQ